MKNKRKIIYWDLIDWDVKPKDINYEHFSK